MLQLIWGLKLHPLLLARNFARKDAISGDVLDKIVTHGGNQSVAMMGLKVGPNEQEVLQLIFPPPPFPPAWGAGALAYQQDKKQR